MAVPMITMLVIMQPAPLMVGAGVEDAEVGARVPVGEREGGMGAGVGATVGATVDGATVGEREGGKVSNLGSSGQTHPSYSNAFASREPLA